MNIEYYGRKKHRTLKRIILAALVIIVAASGFWFGMTGRAAVRSSNKQTPAASAEQKDKTVKQVKTVKAADINMQQKSADNKPVQVKTPSKGRWIKIVKHEHKLYVMDGKNITAQYGVAIGRNSGQKQKSGDCRTPEGNFSVQSIQPAQSWSHNFHDGNGVIPHAYGPWFIRLKTGWNGIGIHGTHDETSIGKNVTEGCIRLKNKNVDELKKKYIKAGTVVIIEK